MAETPNIDQTEQQWAENVSKTSAAYDKITGETSDQQRKLKELSNNLDRKDASKIVSSLSSAIEKIGEMSKNIGRSTAKTYSSITESAKETAKDYSQAVSKDLSVNKQNLVSMSLARATPLFGYFAGKFMETDIFQKFSQSIKEKLGNAVSAVSQKLMSSVRSMWDAGKEKMGSVFSSVVEKGKSIFGKDTEPGPKPVKTSPKDKETEVKKPSISKATMEEIPKLQKGGAIGETGLAKIHPAEVVAPAKQVLSSMKDVARPTKERMDVLTQSVKRLTGISETFGDSFKLMSQRLTIQEEESKKRTGIIKDFINFYKQSRKTEEEQMTREQQMYKMLLDIRNSLVTPQRGLGIVAALSNAWQRTLYEHPGLNAMVGLTKMFASAPIKIVRGLFMTRGNYEAHVMRFARGGSAQDQIVNILTLFYPGVMHRLDEIVKSTSGKEKEDGGWSIAGMLGKGVWKSIAGPTSVLAKTFKTSVESALEGQQRAIEAGEGYGGQKAESLLSAITEGSKRFYKESGIKSMTGKLTETTSNFTDIFTKAGRERRQQRKEQEELQKQKEQERQRFGETPQLLRELTGYAQPVGEFYENNGKLYSVAIQSLSKTDDKLGQVIEMEKIGNEYRMKGIKQGEKQTEHLDDVSDSLRTQRLIKLFMGAFGVVKGTINTVTNILSSISGNLTSLLSGGLAALGLGKFLGAGGTVTTALRGIMGRLGAVGLAAGAGYTIGKVLNDKFVDPWMDQMYKQQNELIKESRKQTTELQKQSSERARKGTKAEERIYAEREAYVPTIVGRKGLSGFEEKFGTKINMESEELMSAITEQMTKRKDFYSQYPTEALRKAYEKFEPKGSTAILPSLLRDEQEYAKKVEKDFYQYVKENVQKAPPTEEKIKSEKQQMRKQGITPESERLTTKAQELYESGKKKAKEAVAGIGETVGYAEEKGKAVAKTMAGEQEKPPMDMARVARAKVTDTAAQVQRFTEEAKKDREEITGAVKNLGEQVNNQITNVSNNVATTMNESISNVTSAGGQSGGGARYSRQELKQIFQGEDLQ